MLPFGEKVGATSMSFNKEEVSELLARCHRRCCICHSFCGVKMETDHIVPKDDGGPDEIDNAIPVCFNCHAEIHSYNDRHPRGRKFRPDELRRHKDQWLRVCDNNPQSLVEQPSSDMNVGPLQALVDEVEFNLAAVKAGDRSGCPLRDEQLLRAIRTGSLSLLAQDLKGAIYEAYVAVGHASLMRQAAVTKRAGGASHSVSGSAPSDPAGAVRRCEELLREAHSQLLGFLGHEAGPGNS